MAPLLPCETGNYLAFGQLPQIKQCVGLPKDLPDAITLDIYREIGEIFEAAETWTGRGKTGVTSAGYCVAYVNGLCVAVV